ncbi:EB module [Trichuris suis]|nr:EB module [Trichuris suis]
MRHIVGGSEPSRFLCFLISCLLVPLLPVCLSIKSPCRGAAINDFCLSDEECNGLFTRCIDNRCNCPNDLEVFNIEENKKVCRPAPSEINAVCQSKCAPPLVCSNGHCICWNAKRVGNTCVVDCPPGESLVGQECKKAVQLGGLCNEDSDCVSAFSECKNKRCTCVAGSFNRGYSCVATCPDGSIPRSTCRKTLQVLPDAADFVQTMDTCPAGQMCMTYGKPNIGHCCPVFCPYGEADLTKSCAKGAPLSDRCPELTTHFCHKLESSFNAVKLCCARPCREPTSFFHSGRCYPLAHFGDACLINEQCEGGRHMTCKQGRCVCESGFEPYNGTFPTCKRRCPLNAMEIAQQCYRKTKLDQACFVDQQCPRNARCREGMCECDCPFKVGMKKACVNPDDPLNIDGFLKGFQSIFVG